MVNPKPNHFILPTFKYSVVFENVLSGNSRIAILFEDNSETTSK